MEHLKLKFLTSEKKLQIRNGIVKRNLVLNEPIVGFSGTTSIKGYIPGVYKKLKAPFKKMKVSRFSTVSTHNTCEKNKDV